MEMALFPLNSRVRLSLHHANAACVSGRHLRGFAGSNRPANRMGGPTHRGQGFQIQDAPSVVQQRAVHSGQQRAPIDINAG